MLKPVIMINRSYHNPKLVRNTSLDYTLQLRAFKRMIFFIKTAAKKMIAMTAEIRPLVESAI